MFVGTYGVRVYPTTEQSFNERVVIGVRTVEERRNHTPHLVVIERRGLDDVVLDPVPPLPRLEITRRPAGTIDTRWGPVPRTAIDASATVVDLPDEQTGVVLVVARAVAEACLDRSDLTFPDDLVRDAAGTVVGCRSLGVVER